METATHLMPAPRRHTLLFGLTLLGATVGCMSLPTPPNGYEIVGSHLHSRQAFTQGLLLHDGNLVECTGMNGESYVRVHQGVDGPILRQYPLPERYFGEGCTIIGHQLYWLTWKHQKGFILDLTSLQLKGEFHYSGEGWGLTTDGTRLILSDGTDELRFINRESYQIERRLKITEAGQPVTNLNELEWVDDRIFANVWQTDRIVVINPSNGHVEQHLELKNLLPAAQRDENTDVLNGIAYDAERKHLLVTGKYWPTLYRLKLTGPAP